MGKTCILFGAGAEQGLGISGGSAFAKTVLGIDAEPMNDAVREYYTNRKKSPGLKNSSWYPDYHKYTWDNKKLLEAAVKKKLLEDALRYSTKEKFDAEVADMITNMSAEEREEVLEKYTSYMGLVDEQFHTLISPRPLGRDKFWSVVACYTRAYLLLAGEMLFPERKGDVLLSKAQYMDILEDPKDAIQKMHDFATAQRDVQSYYSILRDSAIPNIKVITSNYTPACKNIADLSDDNIAYVHGRFGLFELPYEFRVFDVEEESLSADVYFPYIFIQSGVKPIVEERQIDEFAKMLKFLREADKLIVVGYRINSDDNHINGILRSFLLSEKEIVFLDYDSGSTKEMIARRLRIDENDPRLVHLSITKENCYKVFAERLKQ